MIQQTSGQWSSYKKEQSAEWCLNNFPQAKSFKGNAEATWAWKKEICILCVISWITYSRAQTCSQDFIDHGVDSFFSSKFIWKFSPKYFNILFCIILSPVNENLVFISFWGHLCNFGYTRAFSRNLDVILSNSTLLHFVWLHNSVCFLDFISWYQTHLKKYENKYFSSLRFVTEKIVRASSISPGF